MTMFSEVFFVVFLRLIFKCDPCEKGHYCNLNTTTYEAMQFYNVCPEGTRCNYTGVDHIPDLYRDACPLGYWCAKVKSVNNFN